VMLPAGDHTVEFRFMPRILYGGMGLSAMTACVILLMARLRHRQFPSPTQPEATVGEGS